MVRNKVDVEADYVAGGVCASVALIILYLVDV